MSSTLKQAIQALKGRIADAFAAVEAKGGTLPATQDSANLPAAIASIPSGGATGLFYNLEQYGVQSDAVDAINGFYDDKIAESLPFGANNRDVPITISSADLNGGITGGKTKRMYYFMTGGQFRGNVCFFNCKELEYLVISEAANTTINIYGYYVFMNCVKLRAILGKPLYLATNDNYNMFGNCSSLEVVYIKMAAMAGLDLSPCPLLRYECLLYLMNNVEERIGTSATIKLGQTNLDKLNATQEGQDAISAAVAKGWTISA